jgi:hopene-associated glycosyltransferase HpnB
VAQAALCLAGLSFTVWLYLFFLHGRFWRAGQRLGKDAAGMPAEWPVVPVIIPARNEADVIGQTVDSLLRQDYPNPVRIVLVDDNSDDGTADAARRAANAAGRPECLVVVQGMPLPQGWAGKVWAMSQGAARVAREYPQAPYVLFTDADILHAPGNLRRLVARAEADSRDLVSIMVMLAAQGLWERFLIPPFVFFFQMLYPFSRVNDNATAAAAGGCMLVRRSVLERAGGIESIREALIDDCALARRLRGAGGRLWLGLDTETRSARPYGGLRGVWNMVARSAFTQLRYSPLLLAGCVAGMLVVYAVPPLAVAGAPWFGPGAGLAGLAAYVLMVAAYAPTLKMYGRPRIVAALLPVAAMLYTAMTIASAWRHWRGVGGGWKGRVYP